MLTRSLKWVNKKLHHRPIIAHFFVWYNKMTLRNENGKRLLPLDETVRDAYPTLKSSMAEKRAWREGNEKEVVLLALPEDVLCKVLSYLDVVSLLQSRCLSRNFRALASRGSAGWENHCTKLWANKVHIAASAREQTDFMTAYRLSIEDARHRNFISLEELLFDPATRTGTIWSFRFKESAGADWTSWDPWYNDRPCRKMVLLADGSIKEYVPDSDGGGTYLESPPFSERMGDLLAPPLAMSWRFITQPLDMPERPRGSYIRISVAGRDVPTYCVRRSPTKNWGFIMESCWGVYASFELPKRVPPISRRRRVNLRRAQDTLGNWFNVEVDASDEEDVSSANGERSTPASRLLVDDTTFEVSSSTQWKEAFMYNVGARQLPEGAEGLAEFERIYTLVHRQ